MGEEGYSTVERLAPRPAGLVIWLTTARTHGERTNDADITMPPGESVSSDIDGRDYSSLLRLINYDHVRRKSYTASNRLTTGDLVAPSQTKDTQRMGRSVDTLANACVSEPRSRSRSRSESVAVGLRRILVRRRLRSNSSWLRTVKPKPSL